MALFYGFAPKAARNDFPRDFLRLIWHNKLAQGKKNNRPTITEGFAMNALKHMEFIFGAVMAVGCVFAALPTPMAKAPATQAAAAPAMPIQVVVVKAKRMTALEKRRALEIDTGARGGTAGT
jgi:hypothetical protein